jgi:hypothetical protein
VVASFFIPGLGSMLNENVGKGIGILACYILGIILTVFISADPGHAGGCCAQRDLTCACTWPPMTRTTKSWPGWKPAAPKLSGRTATGSFRPGATRCRRWCRMSDQGTPGEPPREPGQIVLAHLPREVDLLVAGMGACCPMAANAPMIT